ncbi:MAG: hypothetical protein ABEH81_01460 [Halopenitus sp.]
MQLIKLGEGRRRIGDVIVEREAVSSVREGAVACIEEGVDPADPDTNPKKREPIYKDEHVVVLPRSTEEDDLYCYMATEKGVIKVPDKSYIFKMMQLL